MLKYTLSNMTKEQLGDEKGHNHMNSVMNKLIYEAIKVTRV